MQITTWLNMGHNNRAPPRETIISHPCLSAGKWTKILFFNVNFIVTNSAFSSVYAEDCAGSFLGDLERIFHLKLIIHVLV